MKANFDRLENGMTLGQGISVLEEKHNKS